MHQQDKPSKAMRYRSYFWLMNACTVAIIYAVIEPLSEYFFGWAADNVLPFPFWAILYAVVLIFILLVPTFLICAKFMRDDYSEALWHRSAAVLAYASAILPFVFLAAVTGLDFALGFPEKASPLLMWAEVEIAWGQAIINTWAGYMMLFVAIFQFLRWRDSR